MMDWISSISGWLGSFSQDPQSLRLGYSAAIGASVFLVAGALYLILSGVLDPLRKRVDSVKEAAPTVGRKKSGKGVLEALGSLFMPTVETKRVRVEDSIALQLFRTMPRALISHGDGLGLERLLKSGLTSKRILQWKGTLRNKIADCFAKKDDLVIVGHGHLGRLFQKEGFLMVPSMRKYWRNPPEDLGWLGILGYANPYISEACEFAIDA